jgi:acyl dehydratase
MLHYEDYHEGQVIPLGPYAVTREEVIAFAQEFDPQPFHMDEDAALRSVLGGLCASGWHSCAMLMRMVCDAYLSQSASLGSSGLDEVKWLKPVFVGETLSGTATIVSRRISSRRPDMGILSSRWELFNEKGEKKLEETGVIFMRVRG